MDDGVKAGGGENGTEDDSSYRQRSFLRSRCPVLLLVLA
jgi:hypothetical protein